jgi:hypothetical protein
LQVFLKEEENYCAKCCKTRQVIERMIAEIPQLKEKIEIEYQDILLLENSENDGVYIAPVVMINGTIFSEGHIPIIKKLSSQLFKMIN